MNIKQKIQSAVTKTRIGKRIAEDHRYRIVLSSALSFFVNLLYALYNGALGIATRSIWFITMCAYYVILSTLRFSAVLCERKNGSAPSIDTEYYVMRLSGILLVLLSFVITGVIYISLLQNIASKYPSIMMITIAAYTFYKITMAIIRAVTQWRSPSPLLAVIRNIGCADAAASVLTLQRSMLVSFGEMDSVNIHTMNLLTGALACLFIMFLGFNMIRKGFKERIDYDSKIKACEGK